MSEKHVRILLTLFWLFILSAWMVSCTVEKRLYNHGYYISWKRNNAGTNSTQKATRSEIQLDNLDPKSTIRSKDVIQFPEETSKTDSAFSIERQATIEQENQREHIQILEKITDSKTNQIEQQKHNKQKSVERMGGFGRAVLLMLTVVLIAAIIPAIILAYLLNPALVGAIIVGILIFGIIALFILAMVQGFSGR